MAQETTTQAPAKMKYFRGIIHRNAQHGAAWFFADDSVNKVVQVACDCEVIVPQYVIDNIKGTVVDRIIVRPVPGKRIGVKKTREKFNRYTFEMMEEVSEAEWNAFQADQATLPIKDDNEDD